MTAVHPLLAELERHQVRVERHGDRLRMKAPTAPPADLLDRVRAHKAELLPLLPNLDARPILHFRPAGSPADAWATLLGWPGETRESLIDHLHARWPGATVRDDDGNDHTTTTEYRPNDHPSKPG